MFKIIEPNGVTYNTKQPERCLNENSLIDYIHGKMSQANEPVDMADFHMRRIRELGIGIPLNVISSFNDILFTVEKMPDKNVRPSWNKYFMDIAELVKTRSTCIRRQVGAVIVKDKRILSTGYNGAPSKCEHCTDTKKCLRQELNIPSGERHEICRASHAEMNSISQAARHGISIDNATIYVTCQPCSLCAKLIINSGIKKICYKGEYPDDMSLKLFEQAGIMLIPYC